MDEFYVILTAETEELKPTKLQLSILRLHLSILFFGDGRSQFHQFNIQFRLLFSPSSPNELKTALVVLLGLSSKIHTVSPSSNRVSSIS
ncbi:hypothetical protein AVEN_112643-1 [Araneus ventricosus]|uniref:Uncharacterized protein n=1 Tax=Araneus ventricosus TaxID=182803 RepID=A0A4Y1ZXN4_ARAVE|nr:hypothetical protein AVEN_22829-1 [Araneus ventricosus]GBL72233.1 hypothetical protein AVEN_212847-1 [Araneus ventricosus]GBO23377.1 hypothetical protein AVEN_78854-1 [Araneus ventricosus]GBO23465.1 hypothetical protein AVEN_112643-1 [Araneus ventricosus]